MSSLGISLLILVVACVGGVVAYNLWLNRCQRASTALSEEPADEAARAEPSLGEAPAPVAAAPYFDNPDNPGVSPGGSASVASGLTDHTADQTAETATQFAATEHAAHNPSQREQHTQYAGESGAGPGDEDSSPGSDALSEQQHTHTNSATPDAGETAPVTDGDPAANDDSAGGDGKKSADQKLQPEDMGRIPARELAKFECVVDLAPLANVPGERLLQLTRDMQRVGGKPIVIEASAGGNAPETLRNGQAYQLLRFSLLLANRNGPLNAMEYSEFVSAVQKVADELDVLADVPDMNHVLVRSRELNNEVSALDAQVAVNVETKEALTPADLERMAGRFDLSEQGNNLYVRLGPDRAPVFSVALGSEPNRMVLLLDVPRVGRTGQPIRKMVECAWNCAQAFEGKMVDDSGHPIDNDLFDRIESQLETHYQALLGAGLPAGSTLARRVFN